MASCREHLADVAKRLELKCVAGWVEKEHGRLFAGLAFETNVGIDYEFCIQIPESLGQLLPLCPFENDTKVWDRDVVAIDGVRVSGCCFCIIDQMSNDLMPEKIEIDPAITAATHAAPQTFCVKLAGSVEVVDRKREMKRLNCGLALGHWMLLVLRTGLKKEIVDQLAGNAIGLCDPTSSIRHFKGSCQHARLERFCHNGETSGSNACWNRDWDNVSLEIFQE